MAQTDVLLGHDVGDVRGPAVEATRQIQGLPPPVTVFERTYSLLRWSMPLLLLWLVVAMAGVWWVAQRDFGVDLPMTSISAYYYTDARTVFVGVVMGLGVLLIVIQGRTPWEEALMNTAGALAPFVALLPTPVRESNNCVQDYCTVEVLKRDKLFAGIPNNEALIEFNIWVVAPIWAILLAYMTCRAGRATQRLDAVTAARGSTTALVKEARADRAASTFSAGAVLVFGVVAMVLWVWNEDSRALFFKSAHLTSAALMVGLLLLSIVPFARWARRSDRPAFQKRPVSLLRNGFGAYLALALVLIAVCIGIATLTSEDWNHKVLVIEAAALGPFVVYWIMQGFALRSHDRHG